MEAAFWSNTETYDTGLTGLAFAITGREDGNLVYVPPDDSINFGTGDFTVSLWVRFNTNVAEQVLIEKYIQTANEETLSTGVSEEFPR